MSSILGVIELTHGGQIKGEHGNESYELVRTEFRDRVRSWLRPEDQMKILDNDRICILLRRIASASQLQLATSKLAKLFERPMDLFGAAINLEVHAGFAMANGRQKNQKALLQQAGTALAGARANKEFHRIFDGRQKTAAESEHELVDGLETALDRGEFELYMQPRMHAGFQTVVGAEAIACWNANGEQLVYPEQYVPVAEERGLIRPITWFALKSAINRAASWTSDINVSVRLSSLLLENDEIHSVVDDALQLFSLPPARLTLEVTEAVMADDPHKKFDHLRLLKQTGVRIAVAEFGSGYTSFSHFRDIPADELKIDEQFVSNLKRSKKDKAIVKSIIGLGRNFGMKIVAAGVDSEETVEQLVELGCDVMQGSCFGPARPVTLFEQEHFAH